MFTLKYEAPPTIFHTEHIKKLSSNTGKWKLISCNERQDNSYLRPSVIKTILM